MMCRSLPDLFGAAFEEAYVQAEAQGLAKKTLKARDLYARMMRVLAQTGNGWMTFKDKSQPRLQSDGEARQYRASLQPVHRDPRSHQRRTETAVCNLGSINLARHVTAGGFDFEKLAHTVEMAVRQLDRVIDLNYYPIASARASNMRWRPVGLGVMGLQDVFFRLRLPFDSDAARALSTRIAEEIYFHALRTSMRVGSTIRRPRRLPGDARRAGRTAVRRLGRDAPATRTAGASCAQEIKAHGLRNSLLIAIAPTATIASIAGCYECIEPQISNLFKRETLSGDFLQVNRYLVEELKQLGLWTEEIRDADQAGRWLGAGARRVAGRSCERFIAPPGSCPMRALIDMAAERGAFIDQSQSLNLFMANPNIGQLSSMYMYAWKRGLKTTYYLRSRPATQIAKTTVRRQGPDAERGGLLARESAELRGLPVSAALDTTGHRAVATGTCSIRASI